MQLSRYDLSYYERLFMAYPRYPILIADRREQLSRREVDENVGGGKSNIMGKPVENLAVRYLSDKRLIFLQNVQESIRDTLNGLDSNTRKMIQLRYFNNDEYNWKQVAKLFNYSLAQVYRIRYHVLETFANRAGFCNTI